MKVQFFSLCGLEDLKEYTKNTDRLEDYLLSVAMGYEDPKDWFFEAMQQLKDLRLISETLIHDVEREQSNDQPDDCRLCREKDLHINDLQMANKDKSEIIKELRRQIVALEKANDLQHQLIDEKKNLSVCK